MNWLNKFPSSEHLLKNAVSTVARFPFVMCSALLGTVAAVRLVELGDRSQSALEWKLLMAAALGVPLLFALVALAEKRQWKKQASLSLQVVGVLLLIGYYFSLPESILRPELTGVRFLMLLVGLHFLAAWLPYYGGDQVQGFWQYNKSLLMRFLMATLYSAAMYVGLVVALAAADYLFGVDVNENRYFQLWIVCAGLLHPWLFLAGIPDKLRELNSSIDYPKALKVFTQYILLPLVALYFVILITYEGKIIFTWNWPKGWVTQLVLWYSVVGILSMLLLHPLRARAENRWIVVFSRRFFWGLLPLVVMMFLAIIRRISDYGLTVNRFFVVAMAIGLAFVVVYFIISKVKDIRIIPIILSVPLFLVTYGPLSAFSVSQRSQTSRLETLLVENGLRSDGVFVEANEALSLESRQEMSSIIKYLDDMHGREAFLVWFDDSAMSVTQTPDTLLRLYWPERIAEQMGFEFATVKTMEVDTAYFQIETELSNLVEVGGYDYLIDVERRGFVGPIIEQLADSITCVVNYDYDSALLTICLSASTFGEDSLELHLADTVKSLLESSKERRQKVDQLKFDLVANNYDARVIVTNIAGSGLAETLQIKVIEASVLLRLH